jgi:hypothetical protein
MARPPSSRPRGASALAIVVVAVAATFGVGCGPEHVAHPDRTEAAFATGAPGTTGLVAGHTNPSHALVTAARPTKERRIVGEALLVGAALIGSLDRSRRRTRPDRRDQPAVASFFARRRGPPSLRLAR